MKLKQKSLTALASGIFVCVAAFSMSSQASAESVLESVMANGKITVATEVAYPPMEFLKGGKVVGYGKDVLDLVPRVWKTKFADNPLQCD